MSDGIFEGDVLLALGENGADFCIEDALVTCDKRFNTAVLLSLFGGNCDENSGAINGEWWGNYCEADAQKNLTSRFLGVVCGSVLTALSAQNAIEAAKNDLQWMRDSGAADEISVFGEIREKGVFSMTVICKKDSVLLAECRYALNWEDIRNGL